MACDCCEPPCPAVSATVSCSTPAVVLGDGELAGICGAGTGAVDPVSIVEVGRAVSGDSTICGGGGVVPPSDIVTVGLSGLQTGCVLFAHVCWAETVNDVSGCGSGLGDVVQVKTGVGVGASSLVTSQQGYDYFQSTLAHFVFSFPVTVNGNGTISFEWPNTFGDPITGMSQIQVFQVCGNVDPLNPVKASVLGRIDAADNNLEIDELGPVTMALPADDCPALYFAAARHSNYVGNPDGAPNGGFNTVGGTETAEYVAYESSSRCQLGQVGGVVNGNQIDAYSAMNIENYYGPIDGQSLWTLIRVNCDTSPVGGEQTFAGCCAAVSNDACNGSQLAAVSFSAPVEVTAAPGSSFAVELLWNGVVVDTVAATGSTVSTDLTWADSVGPVAPGGDSPEQCAGIRVVCDSYVSGANSVNVNAGTLTVEVAP